MDFWEQGTLLTIFEFKCITFHSIYQFNMTVGVFLFCSPHHSSSLDRDARRLEQDFAPRRVPVAALHSRSVLCNISHLTEDDGEIYMNTGVVELHNALKNKTMLKLMKNRSTITSRWSASSKCGSSSPVESGFSESSSTWTFFCHFSSPPSLHRIHGRGLHPRHSTASCQQSE